MRIYKAPVVRTDQKYNVSSESCSLKTKTSAEKSIGPFIIKNVVFSILDDYLVCFKVDLSENCYFVTIAQNYILVHKNKVFGEAKHGLAKTKTCLEYQRRFADVLYRIFFRRF